MPPKESSHVAFSVLDWNIGGSDLIDLPKAIFDVTGSRCAKDDLVLLQELPREKEGWHHQELEGKPVVSHRRSEQWRGTGIWYDPSAWCILRKQHSLRGTWFKLRHLEAHTELWVGTSHFTPGCTVGQYEEEVHDHFRHLPASAVKIIYHGDVTTGFSWVPEQGGITEVPKEGKGGIFHKVITEKGFVVGTPEPAQLHTSTSRPRQEHRQGQCIDIMCYKGVRSKGWHVWVDSYMKLGTDHELCQSRHVLDEHREYHRHETRPRVWVGGVSQIDRMDQAYIEHLAVTCTKPKSGQGYKDTQAIKQAFRMAKRSGSSAQWKQALKMRKQARQAWERDRLIRASEGDWQSFRALKPRRQTGWDLGFAEAQDEDPHQVVHRHLLQVYGGEDLPDRPGRIVGDVQAFTIEELRLGVSQMKTGKAVGADKTSAELIYGLMDVPGGPDHLLEWYNRILTTQVIPSQWNRPVLVLLPKIVAPKQAKDLRPIAMGSAVSKLFSRLLLNRAMPKLRPNTGAQCSGPGRQTNDYLFSAIRLFELAREWGVPLAVFKLDLEKAFDSLDRGALLQRLEERLGEGAELGCWRGLLKGTVGHLQTPWGCTDLPMRRGIKQGAVESPTMFAWIAELALSEAITTYGWHDARKLFEGLTSEEMLYMDDGMVWSGDLPTIQTRVAQLSSELSRYGLKLNPKKCQLYASPKVEGNRWIHVDGMRVDAAQTLEVMGLVLRVGMSVYELASPLTTRARAKFWEMKHIFRAKGGSMKQRARVMQRVVGGTALWCICCLPPNAATMTMLNSVQLQLMVWLLRFSKRPDEGWEEFRQRAFRGARSALRSAGVERWSTLWLRRYWAYAGHRVRCTMHGVPPVSTEFENFRTLTWWNHQKSMRHGIKHQGRHYARLTTLEQNMDAVAGHPWRLLAYDRAKWKAREDAWVQRMDVPWASGRQLSIKP